MAYMRMFGKSAVTMSLVLSAAGAGTAFAADEAKPAAPTLSDVLDSSGITATGYVDTTYSYKSQSSGDANTFALNQAAFTLSKLPTSGFGALVNVAAGTEAGTGLYAPSYSYSGAIGTTTNFDLLQAYIQYISGSVTVVGGKFMTLAGAEVAAPTGNANVTRSLLFWYSEPINHVGLRTTIAASDTTTFSAGVNNGWNANTSTGDGKTFEVGFGFTPSKTFALAGSAYYGDVDKANGLGKKTLVDLVATWTATSALTVIVSADSDKQEYSNGAPSASWWGAAAYLNYAINDTWRTSFRAEYLDDKDGGGTGAAQKLKEGTLTFGYAPAKNFEFRVEGRYDKSDLTGSDDITQAWLQGIFKF
jgi:hypothetical protein